MFARGVVEETAQLLAKGYGRETGAAKGQGIGVAGYLSGTMVALGGACL